MLFTSNSKLTTTTPASASSLFFLIKSPSNFILLLNVEHQGLQEIESEVFLSRARVTYLTQPQYRQQRSNTVQDMMAKLDFRFHDLSGILRKDSKLLSGPVPSSGQVFPGLEMSRSNLAQPTTQPCTPCPAPPSLPTLALWQTAVLHGQRSPDRGSQSFPTPKIFQSLPSGCTKE